MDELEFGADLRTRRDGEGRWGAILPKKTRQNNVNHSVYEGCQEVGQEQRCLCFADSFPLRPGQKLEKQIFEDNKISPNDVLVVLVVLVVLKIWLSDSRIQS